MDEYYFTKVLDDTRTLCLAPLTSRRKAFADIEIEDDSGYFLYEKLGTGDAAEVRILAHVISPEGVNELCELFSLT